MLDEIHKKNSAAFWIQYRKTSRIDVVFSNYTNDLIDEAEKNGKDIFDEMDKLQEELSDIVDEEKQIILALQPKKLTKEEREKQDQELKDFMGN